MTGDRKKFTGRLLPGIAALVFAAGTLQGCLEGYVTGDAFERHAIDTRVEALHDLGVTDIDGDGYMDLFSVNHSSQEMFLINPSGNGFEDIAGHLGLEQSPGFPGYVSTATGPVMGRPGVYLYWLDDRLVVEMRKHHATSLRLGLVGNPELIEASGCHVTDASELVIACASGSGRVVLRPRLAAVPVQVALGARLRPENVYVGTRLVNPLDARFTLELRDRHGMAWADVNGDGVMDVFITRGGLRGDMGELEAPFHDELHLSSPEGFVDAGPERGLAKQGCPGRQVAWTDYDGDGILDVYVACGRASDDQPNQLFRGSAGGRYEDVAGALGLDLGGMGSFRWADVDQDGDQDLLWANRHEAALYTNHDGRFSRILMHKMERGSVPHLQLGDFDGDGDVDVLATGGGRSVLLAWSGSRFEPVDLAALGLPARSDAGSWVDFDNDGLLDLFLSPQGLYRQISSGGFVKADLLELGRGRWSPWKQQAVRFVWLDPDNRGGLDLVVARQYTLRNRWWVEAGLSVVRWITGDTRGSDFWVAEWLENRAAQGHWLEVSLRGQQGNVAGIGATVVLEVDGRRSAQVIGAMDTSLFSQGNYRVHFGLGFREQRPWRLQVQWPDGHRQTLTDVAPDQHLVIHREPAGRPGT